MKVTMYNEKSGVVILGVDERYIKKWQQLGFEVQSYDDPKIVAFRKAS